MTEIATIDKKNICTKHGTERTLNKDGSTRCGQCKRDSQKKRRNLYKTKLVEAHGSKCAICGYCKTSNSLEFHHSDSKKKEFSISSNDVGSFEKLLEESKKCIMICANCHREIHAGLVDVSTIKSSYIGLPDEQIKSLKQLNFDNYQSSHSSIG